MDLENVNQEIDKLSQKLDVDRDNNLISRLCGSVKNNSDTKNVDPEKRRKEKTLTNQDLANMTAPLDQDVGDRYIRLDSDKVQKLDTELRSLRRDLTDLADKILEVDPDKLSKSTTRAKNAIASVEDDFSYSVFTRQNEPIYSQYLKRQGVVKVDKNQREEFLDSIDTVLEECRRASKSLRETELPSDDKISREVRETREERMEQEMEEMRPYMSLSQIKRHFNQGEEFTVKELSEKVDVWSVSTAKSVIQDAADAELPSNSVGLEEVSEGVYKLQ